MYRAFFQLQDNPFSLTPDPDYLFLSTSHQEAYNHLIYAVRERKGFAELIGGPGTGKTTLCRLFLDRADHKTRTAYVFNTFLSDLELLQAISEEFGLGAGPKDRKGLTDRLNRFLIDVAAEGGNAVLLIDEAQNLPQEALEQVRMLSNLETATEKLLQVVLVGSPELHARLGRPELGQFNERVAVRHRLQPLRRAECEAYIMHRLKVAGWRGLPQIETAAIEAVYRFSAGVPRRMNIICDRALLVAFTRGSYRVTGADVERARSELEVLDAPVGESAPGSAYRAGFLAGRLPMLTRLRQSWAAACLLVTLMGIGGFWAWFGGGGKRQAGALEGQPVRQVHKIEQSQRLALEEAGQAGGK
jgi:general secretion pathway protein A